MPLIYGFAYIGIVLYICALSGTAGNVACELVDAWLDSLGGEKK